MCIRVQVYDSAAARREWWKRKQHREGLKSKALFCHAMLRDRAWGAAAKPDGLADTGDSSTTATARAAIYLLGPAPPRNGRITSAHGSKKLENSKFKGRKFEWLLHLDNLHLELRLSAHALR